MRFRRFLRPTWLVGLAATAAVLAQTPPKDDTQPSPFRPFQHRAWYIYHIVQYTEWPKEALPDTASPFVLGILGEDPFKFDIDIIRNKPIKDRKLALRYYTRIEDVGPCQALYICDSEKIRLTQVLKALEGASILTFSELDGFIQQGGMVKFWYEHKTAAEGFLQFQINQAAAEKVGLRINSRVLKLAKPEKKPDSGKEIP